MKAVAYSCVAGLAIATPSAEVLAKFEEFRKKWARNYSGEEYGKRLHYFENHLLKIEELQRQEQGTATYTHLGPFADFSEQEQKQRFGLLPSPNFWENVPVAPLLNISLGESLDWVAKGAVNPIKNQGQCGSCWAFSTACNLEGTGFVTTGKLADVSEQDIVDCDKSDDGCNGGLPSSALQWSSQHGGVASEQNYPYTGRDGSCRSNVGTVIHNTGYQRISEDETQIAQALAKYGPLSIAVDANGFNGYNGGVLRNPSCSKSSLNHAINIVGYGEAGVKYWKVRNSWGTDWGEQGYIRMARGDCQCGLCSQVVTATGVTVSGTPTPPGPSPSPPGPSPNPPGPSPYPPSPYYDYPPGPSPYPPSPYYDYPPGPSPYPPSPYYDYPPGPSPYPPSPYYDYPPGPSPYPPSPYYDYPPGPSPYPPSPYYDYPPGPSPYPPSPYYDYPPSPYDYDDDGVDNNIALVGGNASVVVVV